MVSTPGAGDQTDFTKLPRSEDGSFKRQVSSFRDTIEKGGGGKFEPEPGRYHIYASYNCRMCLFALLSGASANA